MSSVGFVIAVVLIIAALTLSWFLTNNSLSTVAKVDSPAELKITVPGESAGATQLDLTNDADYDKVAEDGRVYRSRAFSVDSGGNAFRAAGCEHNEHQRPEREDSIVPR